MTTQEQQFHVAGMMLHLNTELQYGLQTGSVVNLLKGSILTAFLICFRWRDLDQQGFTSIRGRMEVKPCWIRATL